MIQSQPYEAVPTASGHDVLATLRDEYAPDHIYAAVSGGDDSITALHFAMQSPEIDLDGVVHIDTGIGIGETTNFVRERCDEWGLDLIVLSNDNARFGHERYESLVRRFGFPGANPIAHSSMWKNLKDKPLSSRFKNSVEGDLGLISGVRKHESANRYEALTADESADGVQETGGLTWASPLVEWTDEDLAAYREYHDIPENTVAAVLCTSGECLCGCYADRQNLPLIRELYPETAHQIQQLEWIALEQAARGEFPVEYALWAHGAVDAGEYNARTDSQQTGLMCSDCDDQCPATPYEIDNNPVTPAERFLCSNSLSEFWNWPFYCAVCDIVVEDPKRHRDDVHPFDADYGLEAEWDLRKILPGQSDACGEIITEPNGWNLDPGQLTNDRDEADRYKHTYHCDDVALSHCTNHDHDWATYNEGPVQQCQDCFAFNLSAYTPADAGPPRTPPASELTRPLTQTEEQAQRIHKTLEQFR